MGMEIFFMIMFCATTLKLASVNAELKTKNDVIAKLTQVLEDNNIKIPQDEKHP